MIYRAGEEAITSKFFRSERLVQINGGWFFITRGGSQEGPFSSTQEAQQFLEMFLALSQSRLAKEMQEVNTSSQRPRAAQASAPTLSSSPHSEGVKAQRPCPFGQVASVVKPPFNVRRIEFTPVAQDVQEVSTSNARSANDSFHFCCL
ncbi:MAG: DUF6316 family protein [Pseudomonadales bacterium]